MEQGGKEEVGAGFSRPVPLSHRPSCRASADARGTETKRRSLAVIGPIACKSQSPAYRCPIRADARETGTLGHVTHRGHSGWCGGLPAAGLAQAEAQVQRPASRYTCRRARDLHLHFACHDA